MSKPSMFKRAKPLPVLSEMDKSRFAGSVDRSGGPDACWPYTGTVGPYGRFKAQGRALQAHRVAYSIAHGDSLADAAVVRHSCDNPPCCNPAHLLPGTYLDNVIDMDTRQRRGQARGTDFRHAVANDNLVREIRASPLSGREAAKHFGLAYGTVGSIRSGRSWTHVDSAANAA